jgi:hypothetical protein
MHSYLLRQAAKRMLHLQQMLQQQQQGWQESLSKPQLQGQVSILSVLGEAAVATAAR